MCGIYGSTCFDKFKQLYNSNTTRGNFANGHVFIGKDRPTLHISKSPGIKKYTAPPKDSIEIYLGHTQSPTGSVRDFHPATTHPFENKNWVIAHNGIINNFNKLKEDYVPYHKCNVDSSIVMSLLEMYHVSRHTVEENHKNVQRVLNMLSGTYGIFMYSKIHNILYVARSGSTMYYDPVDVSFSSTKFTNMIELPEHILYMIKDKQLHRLTSLSNNSSFLIL